MVRSAEYTVNGVLKDLLERGHEFSFPQVLRLACAHLGPDALERNLIKVRPKLSLEFPAADVDTVERTSDSGLLVTTTFGGLYGVDSPLPTFETEDLFDDESSDRTAARDFLDIIHQRLYYLYATCWSKYRTLIRIVEERNPADIQRAWCLLGMGEKELSELVPHSFPFLRYSGLFSRLTRPVSALEAMLKDALASTASKSSKGTTGDGTNGGTNGGTTGEGHHRGGAPPHHRGRSCFIALGGTTGAPPGTFLLYCVRFIELIIAK